MTLLAIYLNDHLAAATGAVELVRRAAGSNRGSEYGSLLARLALEIEEEREVLLAIMRALDVGVDRLKVLGGWSAEKVGRLKLNGRLLAYSPLSRLEELEILELGIAGRRALWRTLEHVCGQEAALAAFDLQGLLARAERQLAEVEEQRLAAALDAFL